MVWNIAVLAAALAAVIAVWIHSRKVAKKRTRDFYTILQGMESVQEGNLDRLIELEQDNEFRQIADAYNEMIRSLKLQMEKNQKMAELVAASQTKQLESQFNPHFLFNTLENIRYMYKLDPAAAETMILSLSNLLRYSLDSTFRLVPLEEDLVHLKNYLSILKYRFNRRLSYNISVAKEAKSCLIPRLIIQPMIENAVKYGFGNHRTLHIELKAYCHEDKLIIICRDNGVGMTAGELDRVSQILEQEENSSSHYGLYNIHRRLYLLYGAPYGVKIRSQEGYGTTLVVTSPARTEEKA